MSFLHVYRSIKLTPLLSLSLVPPLSKNTHQACHFVNQNIANSKITDSHRILRVVLLFISGCPLGKSMVEEALGYNITLLSIFPPL